jgi:hypothetical protein
MSEPTECNAARFRLPGRGVPGDDRPDPARAQISYRWHPRVPRRGARRWPRTWSRTVTASISSASLSIPTHCGTWGGPSRRVCPVRPPARYRWRGDLCRTRCCAWPASRMPWRNTALSRGNRSALSHGRRM